MRLEFVGGSHDGKVLEVGEESLPVFLLPLIMEPAPPQIIPEGELDRFTAPPFEVYEQTEPGKLLFQGWNE